jgi:clusterin-associated protein 1
LETESARVAFLTAVCAAIASKARILLKTKHLYAADGRAVKEMLKVARVIYKCVPETRAE